MTTQKRWRRTWIATVLTLCVLLGSSEFALRSVGVRPTIRDELKISTIRAAIEHTDSASVLLLGSSRMVEDVDERLLSTALNGRRVLSLAMNGTSCLPALEEISMHSAFHGTVVCGLDPAFAFTATQVAWAQHETTAGAIALPSAARRMDVSLQLAFSRRLSLVGNDFRDVLQWKLRGGPMRLVQSDTDVFHRAFARHFAGTDTAIDMMGEVRKVRDVGAAAASPAEVTLIARRVASLDQRLRQRGARLLLLEMPSSGAVRDAESRLFPREHYWRELLRQSGVPGIASRDTPAIAALSCPDGSHLDARDVAEFTSYVAMVVLEFPDFSGQL